jgi:hypothetical protein
LPGPGNSAYRTMGDKDCLTPDTGLILFALPATRDWNGV